MINRYVTPGFLLVFFTCYLSVSLFSQANYETNKNYVLEKKVENAFLTDSVYQSVIDTNISNIHNYVPRNFSGNIGLPNPEWQIQFRNTPLGFRLYNLPYKNDLIESKDVSYYATKGPYAELLGLIGSKQEQMVRFLFTQTFKNNLNLALKFNRYGSQGFYRKQQTFTNNFYVSSNYKTKTERFGYYGYFLFNKLNALENGGISSDTSFVKDVAINKELLPINLSNAKRQTRLMDVSFNPWWRLNKTNDSTHTVLGFIDYKINYTSNYFKYVDEGISSDSIYPNIYIDSVKTNDSAAIRQLSNELNYVLKFKSLRTDLSLGYKNERTYLYEYVDSIINNNSVHARLRYNATDLHANITANYVYSGYNASDYSITGNLIKRLPKIKNTLIQLKALVESRQPDYMYENWYSNHFVWNYNYGTTQTQQLQLTVGVPDWKLTVGLNYSLTSNLLYFDNIARPKQYGGSVQNMSLTVKKQLLLFNHLGFDNTVLLQHTSDTNLVRIPQLYAQSQLYYAGNLFKRNLALQTGFQCEYYSGYTPSAYMPATNIFYLQNTRRVGEYPYVDFFINARIRPAKFFIKIEHIFQGMFGTGYSLMPGYIQPDRAFKFGLNWFFFD